eukprot:gene4228-2281_t
MLPKGCARPIKLTQTETGGWTVLEEKQNFWEEYGRIRECLPKRMQKRTYSVEQGKKIQWSSNKGVGQRPPSEKVNGLHVAGEAPLNGTLHRQLEMWKSIGLEQYDIVRNGFKPKQDAPLAPIYMRNGAKQEDEQEVNEWLDTQLSANLIKPYNLQELGYPQSIVSILITYSGQKKRIVLDYSPINASMEAQPFTLPDIVDIYHFVEPGQGIWKTDLTKGFQHMIHHNDARGLAAIVWDNVAYELVACQLGMNQVPKAFQTLTSGVARRLSESGPASLVYLDDYFGSATSASKWTKLATRLQLPETANPIEILKQLGFALGRDKTLWPPVSEGDILGFTINANKKTIAVTNKKIERMEEELQRIIGLKKVEVRILAKMAGKIAACRAAWPGAAIVANLMLTQVAEHIRDKMSHRDWDEDLQAIWCDTVATPKEAIREVVEWVKFCTEIGPRPFYPTQQMLIESDASSSGRGAIVTDGERYWVLSEPGEGNHINVEELLAAIRSIETSPQREVPTSALIRVDSTVAKSWLVKGSTRGDKLPLIVRLLRAMRQKRMYIDNVEWIPSEENEVADILSRLPKPWDRRTFENWADQMTPRPTCDAFASDQDALLNIYCTRYASQHATYTDYFRTTFPDDMVLWVNPPFKLLSKVLHHIKTKQQT